MLILVLKKQLCRLIFLCVLCIFDQFNKSLLYKSFKYLTDPKLLNETVIKVSYWITFMPLM